jgi:hypothetical protein
MDARLLKAAVLLSTLTSLGATYRTPNFDVQAPSAEIAQKVGRAAEYYRDELAVQWLGKKLPQWYRPCPIRVKVGQIGAGGATSFSFDRGEVFGWNMRVQGSLERILDSVIPHEVSHTIFASHFRRPLPRWADEGAATLIEHESERRRQRLVLKQVWNTGRRISMRRLLSIKEYPRDMQQVLTLYAQGYSLADFLVQAGGKANYLSFLDEAHRNGWDKALRRHYKLDSVESLEKRWTGWVVAGSPPLKIPKGQQLARADHASEQPPRPPVIRSQSPDPARSYRAKPGPRGTKRRGENLVAPDPSSKRQVITVTTSPRRTTTAQPELSPILSAETIAINDGWVPVAEPRRSRPVPLAVRIPYSELSSSGGQFPTKIDPRNGRRGGSLTEFR